MLGAVIGRQLDLTAQAVAELLLRRSEPDV